MMKTIYTVRLNNGLTAPCDCNYVSSVQGEIVGYMDLRGALRFSTKQEAADALRRLPEPVRHKHIVAEVPVLQLLYFPPVPFPVSWTVKMKKKQKETQDILSYHTQAAGCSDKARAKASGGRQPIEECGRTGL